MATDPELDGDLMALRGSESPPPLELSRAPIPAEYDHDRPWERQPCDKPRRWYAFLLYRGMRNGSRSLRAVWELLQKVDPAGRWNIKSLEQWSSADGWVARARAFDEWKATEWAKQVDDILAETARSRAARHVSLLQDMQQLATMACKEILEEARKPGAKLRWSPREISRVVKEALTLERLVFGETTERTETSVGFQLERLSIDELRQLRELETKAGMLE